MGLEGWRHGGLDTAFSQASNPPTFPNITDSENQNPVEGGFLSIEANLSARLLAAIDTIKDGYNLQRLFSRDR